MIFGWGRKKPPEEPQITIIRLDEIVDVAEKTRHIRAERTITKAGNLAHKTNTLIRELVQIRKDIEMDDLEEEEEIDPRIRPLVIKGKKMLIEALKKNAVEIEPIHDYKGMVQANKDLEHRLKRVGNILGKQSRVVHVFAEEYAARLKQILEEIEDNRKELLSTTTWHQNDNELAETITGGIKNVHSMEMLINDNGKSVSESEQESNDISSKMAQTEAEIADFKKSAEYNRWLNLCDLMERHKRDRVALKMEISTQFTKISRPLGRYSRISADKEQTALLERLLDDAYDTIRLADSGSVIELLEGVRRATSSGSISVKDVSKALEAIMQTQEAIGRFVDKINNLEAEVQKTTVDMEDVKPAKMDLLKKDMYNLKETQELIQKKISNIKNTTTKTEESIPKEIKKIHEALEKITGMRYEIKY
ncbi:MAG: hypothetical protein F4W68_06025 [Cenarchaeum sp. SB0661_bin_35]|nr:hypothetical protein [Cenarchaeum sp. SB0666_bin_15]MYB46160.1 hypothetical protein [Cenarchaeum sp. SB0662_bin_33]MYC80033.1 hypothetical protein [Cenarchaeum sp. SB0661_bin_35]MYD58677.1 hypothetical protein [Cenarchaeum sp. SB0678_bin_8]MYJ27364.1 hypothetical protein [Cenarchaeum sp. SB0672_bin_9]